MLDLHGISRAAFDLIVACEVTSQAVYERRYRHPEWPEEQSGVTCGIGYDFGQQSRAQILADWSGNIPAAMVKALAKCAGVTGPAAKPLAASLRSVVDIPWDVALDVFGNRDVPRYLAMCERALPDFGELVPDCRGAILSIVFNRGASFGLAGPRYAEMRGIKAAMKAGDLAKIPGLIRSMKRLWPAGSGLRPRRDAEAALFEKGLAASHPHLLEDVDAVAAVPDPDVVAGVQSRLRALGYFGVGAIDGSLDPQGKTEDAILAFRNRNGLPLTPDIDDDFLTALAKAPPLEVAEERASATTDDLRAQQSETIGFTDRVKGWAGKLFGGGAGLGGMFSLAAVTDRVTQVNQAKEAVGGLGLTPQAIALIGVGVVALLAIAGIALLLWHVADRIEHKRLADYRVGKNP